MAIVNLILLPNYFGTPRVILSGKRSVKRLLTLFLLMLSGLTASAMNRTWSRARSEPLRTGIPYSPDVPGTMVKVRIGTL
jgi:hypothetical protein